MAQSRLPAKCDVLVIGAGAGGLSAAVTARLHGLDVVVIEKSDRYGGTTARSGGGLWLPGNPLSADAGFEDNLEAAREYIRYHAGAFYDEDVVDSYLMNGPRMVEFFQKRTAVRFILQRTMPDYHLDAAGSVHGGRTIYAAPFHASELGRYAEDIAPPLRELTFLGMGISRTDLQHFFKTFRSFKSTVFVGRRLAAHSLDLVRYRRSMHFVNGQALVGRLMKSALDSGVKLWKSAPATELIAENGSVIGAVVTHDGRATIITARGGVVLACGGIGHGSRWQHRLYPHVRKGSVHRSLAPGDNTGDGLLLGERAGGVIRAYSNSGYWAPVSLIPRKHGPSGAFPHTNGLDRSKPGFICVLRSGVRFICECATYHEFVQAMVEQAAPGTEPEAFIIGDHRAIRRYGMGAAKPFPLRLAPHLQSGYIVSAPTIEDLARRIGIDAEALPETVRAFNAEAEQGRDPQFGKGSNRYHWYQGDPDHRPNPCLAPLRDPPFYALRLTVGDVGSLSGLWTDAAARVLTASERPIEGLYAAGNDMASLCGGDTPGAGITLGPAMTFGYVAAMHILDRCRSGAAPRSGEEPG